MSCNSPSLTRALRGVEPLQDIHSSYAIKVSRWPSSHLAEQLPLYQLPSSPITVRLAIDFHNSPKSSSNTSSSKQVPLTVPLLLQQMCQCSRLISTFPAKSNWSRSHWTSSTFWFSTDSWTQAVVDNLNKATINSRYIYLRMDVNRNHCIICPKCIP